MSAAPSELLPPRLLSDEAEGVARRIAEHDWQSTPLGPIAGWPPSRMRSLSFALQQPVATVTLWGSDGILIPNDAFVRLVGLADSALIGRPVREVFPRLNGLSSRILAACLAGRQLTLTDEPILVQREGASETVRLRLDVFPVARDGGQPEGAIVTVTESRHDAGGVAVGEPAPEYRRLREMAEDAPLAIALVEGPAHVIALANAACRRLLGVDELVGRPAAEVVPSGRWGRLLDRVRADAEPHAEHAVRALVAGRERFLDVSLQPTGGAGVGGGIFVLVHDVTDSRRAEAALRAESRRLEALNRTGAALASELDPEVILRRVAEAGIAVTGAAAGAVVHDGDGAARRVATAGRPDLAAELAAEFAPGFASEPVDGVTNGAAGGRAALPLPEALTSADGAAGSRLEAPLLSTDGRVVGAIFLMHPDASRFDAAAGDLTLGIAGQASVALEKARLFQVVERELAERRRAEAALQALNETLEQRVSDAVKERAEVEEAMRHAQKLEAIGRLTGGVAHDFNNILQVISGNLQLLAKDVAADPRSAQRVRTALASVRHGATLANQLLAFGRRQPLLPKAVNAGRLVAGMTELLQRTLGSSIDIEVDAAPDLWNCLVDPQQLETAVINLAINASDAMNGGGRLRIAAENARLGGAPPRPVGEFVALSVTDSGCGIPAEILDRVFDPFFTTKPVGKGTGLGLSMVYGFVRQSGGHVEIASTPGSGTTVRLLLPRTATAEEPLAPGPRPEPTEAEGGRESILVVEDDGRVRGTVIDLLEDLGYQTLEARDPMRALAILETPVRVDLVFTDVVMPGPIRSPEFAQLARSRRPGIRVLFTSGYSEDVIVHDGRLDAGVELLPKPYSREILAQRLRSIMKGDGSMPAANAPPPPSARTAKAGDAATALPAATVLVVEDDPLIRLGAADILREAGLTVLEAGSAAEARHALARGATDLLLVDVGLPDASGVALAGEIRALHPALPVVFATGHLEVPGIEAIPEPRAVLSKPFGEADLRAVVSRFLRGT